MNDLIAALWAERLKLKRTLALWLAFIAPLSIVALQALVITQRLDMYIHAEGNPWIGLADSILPYWTWMALPLFIGLQAALVAGVEHRNEQWKHLYALPLSRAALYLAKQGAVMVLIGLSALALPIFILLAGLGLHLLEPALGFSTDIPWGRLALFSASMYGASWLAISIHTWIGQRWPSFVVSITVAVAGSLAALLLSDSLLGSILPWNLPRLACENFATAEVGWPALIGGVVLGVAFAAWGCRDVTRRDVL